MIVPKSHIAPKKRADPIRIQIRWLTDSLMLSPFFAFISKEIAEETIIIKTTNIPMYFTIFRRYPQEFFPGKKRHSTFVLNELFLLIQEILKTLSSDLLSTSLLAKSFSKFGAGEVFANPIGRRNVSAHKSRKQIFFRHFMIKRANC